TRFKDFPMRRFATLAMVALLAAPAVAQETMSPEVLAAVKKASVFIRLDAGDGGGTGSGWVAVVDGARALIVTNNHVAPPDEPLKPGEVAKLRVVFDSGTPTERSFPAELVAADKWRDLAVLRVSGVKNLPNPLPYDPPTKPMELLQIFSF